MDLNDLKELLGVLQQQDFGEFELECEGWRLRIRKGASGGESVGRSESGGGAAVGAKAVIASEETPHREVCEDDDLVIVKSPMVGTFYRSANPASPAFVSVGERIREGQILCIIEAMKLMNEIEAELAGDLVRVFVENGQAVQYGDPLFAVRAA